ncbi:MAG: glycosyltransferase family 2 protein [Chloroflexota bacterium]|nr:glycosyltransferase family 2 protein [Chloroflexota bacterium]MDE2942186.1 glycosyltransferase family 2 protein [Chloroflexota bacterium]MDE3267513.1 glycosyltransferase family 2 protein [Chloroflexota bacterium]
MPPRVDVVIPVLNEERALPICVDMLLRFLGESSPYPFRIVIADNGSTDRTPEIAEALSQENWPRVAWSRLEIRGRGRALRKAWLESDADILTYMDVDLSTDLAAFPPMVKAIGEEGFDLAVGSRLMKGSNVSKRTLKREITSRSYNVIIKATFFTRFSDAQCGFKAISSSAAQALVPKVLDQGWFFDSELLILAEKGGYRIKDIPVRWVDDPDTRVRVVKTAIDDLKGLYRLRFGGVSRALKSDGG